MYSHALTPLSTALCVSSPITEEVSGSPIMGKGDEGGPDTAVRKRKRRGREDIIKAKRAKESKGARGTKGKKSNRGEDNPAPSGWPT